MLQFDNITENGFCVLRISGPVFSDEDAQDVAQQLKEHLVKGRRRIALAFEPAAYPYSKVISILTHCYRVKQEFNAELVVIPPNKEFLKVLEDTKLTKVITIMNSENELKQRRCLP